MKKLILVPLAVILVFSFIFYGCAAPEPTPAPPSPAEPIVLKGLTVFDPERPQVAHIQWYADRVNEQAKGELILDMIGGPEVVGMFDQPEALKDGAIDYLATFAASYKAMVPETVVSSVSEYMPWEERESGFYDFMVEAHARPEMNAHCLGRACFGGFYFFGDKPIQTLEDFKGIKVGVTMLWEPLSKALGCVPVLVEEPDIYTAMDRGVIEAYIGPPALPTDFGIYEITEYCIKPLFYYQANTFHLVNLDTWNRLPQHLQELMDNVAAEIEPDWREYIDDLNDAQLQESLDGGMEVIELPPAVAKEYLSICNSVLWEEVEPLVSPETYARLQQTLLK